jgi:hypothetical protein
MRAFKKEEEEGGEQKRREGRRARERERERERELERERERDRYVEFHLKTFRKQKYIRPLKKDTKNTRSVETVRSPAILLQYAFYSRVTQFPRSNLSA